MALRGVRGRTPRRISEPGSDHIFCRKGGSYLVSGSTTTTRAPGLRWYAAEFSALTPAYPAPTITRSHSIRTRTLILELYFCVSRTLFGIRNAGNAGNARTGTRGVQHQHNELFILPFRKLLTFFIYAIFEGGFHRITVVFLSFYDFWRQKGSGPVTCPPGRAIPRDPIGDAALLLRLTAVFAGASGLSVAPDGTPTRLRHLYRPLVPSLREWEDRRGTSSFLVLL